MDRDEAEVEHTLAKQLVQELNAMQPDELLYGVKFTVLGEYLAHHIEGKGRCSQRSKRPRWISIP
jgi:hypothetical protein